MRITVRDWKSADFDIARVRRFCDVVMKGGVTSGVVYPPALCHLASEYVLQNIGGTSVGAIAAAITAAAEFRRRRTGTGDGYLTLSRLPAFLTQDGALLKLFAADPKAKGLLRTALCLIGSEPLVWRLVKAIGGALWSYCLLMAPIAALLAYCVLAPAFEVASANLHSSPHSWWLVLPAMVTSAVVALVLLGALLLFFSCHCIGILATNDFGWTHAFEAKAASEFQKTLTDLERQGKDVTSLAASQTPRLFDWLDAFIAEAAGRPRDVPLTFGDLTSAPPPDWSEPEDRCGINFQVVTTCLSLGRPFNVPFDPKAAFGAGATSDDRANLYFIESDLRKYFPQHIVEHMMEKGGPDPLNRKVGQETAYCLPANDDLPILVAVRMSMSFPVLFCATRLFAPDGNGTLCSIWFSDGGLSSNFPIHLFDSPLPRWPTFALDLLGGGNPTPTPADTMVESDVPNLTIEPRCDLGGTRTLGKVLDFGSAMIDAMRNWQDTTLGALPGNSSRTIGVRLPENEGGINLNMQPKQITDLINRGEQAGDLIVDRFVGIPAVDDTPSWRTQRWLRYLATMDAATHWLAYFKKRLKPFGTQSSYAQMSGANFEGNPTPLPMHAPAPLWSDAGEAEAAVEAASAVAGVAVPVEVRNSFASIAPQPRATLRLRPPT